jgi:hypothetical protein
MIFSAFLVLAAATTDTVCDADSEDQVCLMQFMNRKHGESLDFREQIEALLGDHKEHHEHEDCPECPGERFAAAADTGICSHGGAEIRVLFDSEDIQSYFGDNVMMSHFRYFLESIPSGKCTADCELINPDVHHHQYQVGTTLVRVDGYDLAGNHRSCHRTVAIFDEQPPKFAERPDDLDTTVTIAFPDGTCHIDAGLPFQTYETLGFVAEATDNCDEDVQIIKKIYESGVVVTGANLTGPGSRTLEYTAIDDHSDGLFVNHTLTHKTTTHTVELNLVDETPPSGFADCPESQFIEVEAHETFAHVDWIPPVVTGDNCDEFFELPPAEEQHTPPHHPGEAFEVGKIHTVTYAFKDAAGNYMEEMCSFTIEVVPKAHPVVITCPPSVTVPSLEHSAFGIVKWPEPIVMQHEKRLTGPDYISYPQTVESGMPFGFGVTSVTVHATGEITGNRTREADQGDECTFNVTVTDPESPRVDGSMYRCQSESEGAAPYAICGGKNTLVTLFKTYLDTHGYEVVGTKEESKSCCTSEEAVEHTCTAVPAAAGSSPAQYCTPAR